MKKEFGKILGKMMGVDVNAINITKTESSSSNYLKNRVPSAPAEICTSYRGKKLHKNLVSFSDTSFLYIRRNWSCYCV
jgi:hypothetical protein